MNMKLPLPSRNADALRNPLLGPRQAPEKAIEALTNRFRKPMVDLLKDTVNTFLCHLKDAAMQHLHMHPK
jgi:hypothetical protein